MARAWDGGTKTVFLLALLGDVFCLHANCLPLLGCCMRLLIKLLQYAPNLPILRVNLLLLAKLLRILDRKYCCKCKALFVSAKYF